VGPIDRRIRHTLNSYANARKEPRRQYIHTRTPEASVYTLRPVFCIPSSELIQSRGPPGDFRCGEIVIVTRYFIELSRWKEKGDAQWRCEAPSHPNCLVTWVQTCRPVAWKGILRVLNPDRSRQMYVTRESPGVKQGKPSDATMFYTQ